MDAAAELGRNPVSTRLSLSMEMNRLTRDGTAEPVSRDQILRHARGQGNIIFPVQLTTSRIGNLAPLIHTMLYVMTIRTYIYTCDDYMLAVVQGNANMNFVEDRGGEHRKSNQVFPRRMVTAADVQLLLLHC